MFPHMKAALFDMDGVLLDTEPLYTVATERVVSVYGKHYDFALKRRIMGGSARVGAKVVVEALDLPISPEEYLASRREHLDVLFRTTEAIEGAAHLVQTLSSKGYRMAVATSSERSLFELKTRNHAWFSSFDAIVCGDDPELHAPKPAPDIFLLAAARIGVPPESCFAFEDSPNGVQAAKSAGCYVVARRDLALTEAELSLADRTIVRYAELDVEQFPRAATDG